MESTGSVSSCYRWYIWQTGFGNVQEPISNRHAVCFLCLKHGITFAKVLYKIKAICLLKLDLSWYWMNVANTVDCDLSVFTFTVFKIAWCSPVILHYYVPWNSRWFLLHPRWSSVEGTSAEVCTYPRLQEVVHVSFVPPNNVTCTTTAVTLDG